MLILLDTCAASRIREAEQGCFLAPPALRVVASSKLQ
jgi:hypothetical protein